MSHRSNNLASGLNPGTYSESLEKYSYQIERAYSALVNIARIKETKY